jgi:hypothetical protein
MPGRPDPDAVLDPLIQISDAHRRHRNHHLPVLSTLAVRSHPRTRGASQASPGQAGRARVARPISASRLSNNGGLDSGEPDPLLLQADRRREGVRDQTCIECRLRRAAADELPLTARGGLEVRPSGTAPVTKDPACLDRAAGSLPLVGICGRTTGHREVRGLTAVDIATVSACASLMKAVGEMDSL